MDVRKEYRFDLKGDGVLLSPHVDCATLMSEGAPENSFYLCLYPEHIEKLEELLNALKAIRDRRLEPASS